jgi:hypothetical protein
VAGGAAGRALLCAAAGFFLGFFEAVGIGLDGDHLAAMDEAIDQGDDRGGIREDLAPLGKLLVGGDQ